MRRLSAWLDRQPLSLFGLVAFAAGSAIWAGVLYFQAWGMQERHADGAMLLHERLFISNVLIMAMLYAAPVLWGELRRRRQRRRASPLTGFVFWALFALGIGIIGVLSA